MSTLKNKEQKEKRKNNWLYDIGDNIKDSQRNLTVLEKEKRDYEYKGKIQKQKWYKLYCNNCKCNEIYIKETHLKQQRGCPVCSGRKIVVGINDINTTANWMTKYLKNKNDALIYSKASNSRVDFQCPDCGDITNQKISNVYTFGYNCKKCSDGLSYPNKFSYALLEQLPVENVIHEYSPKWIYPKRFDNYFEYNGKKYILEMDGGFHYNDNTLNNNDVSITIENDKYKDDKAFEFGITVIRINCIRSIFEDIRDEFLNNKILNSLFNMKDLDYIKCHEFAISNVTKVVCDYYNTVENVSLCMSKFNLARNTILSYLKNGNLLGWCNYSVEKSYKNRIDNISRKPIIISINENEMMFNSAKELCAFMKINYDIDLKDYSVRHASKNNTSYKGFKFKYA